MASRIGASININAATLPTDARVLDIISRARGDGQSIYLAAPEEDADLRAIAQHLDMDFIIAPRGTRADQLAAQFGDAGFDYIGCDRADLPVWAKAGKAYGARLDPALGAHLSNLAPDADIDLARAPGWRVWLKALRVHQYTKNLLILVPIFTAHSLDAAIFIDAALGVIAFSLCASGVYLLNDMMDLAADRAHPRKRRRPFASGDLSIAAGARAAAALFCGSLIVAAFLPQKFLLILIGYLVLTTAYTFWLKRQMAVDVVVLALLYTTRILAGGYATGIVVSEWLLALSTFIFTALALMKRYVELVALLEHDLDDPLNRDYKRSDLPVIAALAAASAMNSVTIFALYLSSAPVISAYSRPRALWLMCPLLLYWLARALMMAHRGVMDDDPIVFALRDRISWLTIASMAGVFLLAL